MSEWWNGLDPILKVLYCIAVPSSLILIIQTIISLCGIGDGGSGIEMSDTSGLDLSDLPDDMPDMSADVDTDISNMSDGGNPADIGALRLFTLQTVIAFLTVFSWVSIISYGGGTPAFAAMLIGAAFGAAAMFGVAKIMSLSKRLSESGTIELKNALGEHGTVYLTIPESGGGEGKVTLTVQGRFMELPAVQDGREPMKTGASVRIIDLRGDTLVVEKDG